LDDAAAFIRAIVVRTGLESAREIGLYLLNNFYDGEFSKVHDLGRKHPGVRALSRRTDLGVSASFLWRSLAIVEQWPLLPPEIASSLPLGHHQVLLSVKGREQKVAMAAAAVESRWNYREIFESARQYRQARAAIEPRRGRRPQAPGARAVHAIRQLAAEVERTCRDEEALAAVPKHELRILGEELDAVIDRLDDLLDNIRGVVEDSAESNGAALALPGAVIA
jgi:hypothetical protein